MFCLDADPFFGLSPTYSFAEQYESSYVKPKLQSIVENSPIEAFIELSPEVGLGGMERYLAQH